MAQQAPGALAQGGFRTLLVLLFVQGSTAQTCNSGTSCASSITNCSGNAATLNSCGAGTYSFLGCSTTTKYQCICCPTGSNSPARTTSITGCTCNPGFGGNATGSPTCCTACAAGTYKVASGNTACTPCPANTATVSTGSTAISACRCDAGYGGNASTSVAAGCTACAPGFYKLSPGNAECTACPPHSTNSPGPTSQTSCSCNAGYGGNALAGGCTLTKGVAWDIGSIILMLLGIVPEIYKCYQVRAWSERRKDQLKKPGCDVCYKMTGCVLWWDMSAAKKYDFKYNVFTSFFLIVLTILKGIIPGSSTTNAAQVNAILIILSMPCEFYDWWVLHFKSQDDESETITTRYVLFGKIGQIIIAVAFLVYETAKSALSNNSVIVVVAVAFILNAVVLGLETYTLCHTRVRILQQQQMGQLAPLSGHLGFQSPYSGGAQFPPPQYNVPQQYQMGQEGPAGPQFYFDGGPAAPARPQYYVPQQQQMGPNPGAFPWGNGVGRNHN